MDSLDLIDSLEQKVKRSFKKIRISPTFLISGILLGFIDAIITPYNKSGLKIFNQDPSLFQYSLFGLGLVGINYTNNVYERRTKKNCIYNAKVCSGNYTIGYIFGYVLTKIFN